nr:hypothetical protein [Tanacetum cinerariifolium]
GFGTTLSQVPSPGRRRVLQGFQRAEGLGGDNEQRGFSAQLAGELVQLGAVDVRQIVAANAFLRAHFVGQIDQQLAGFCGDQVFRVIEKQPGAAEGEFVETLRVFVERLAHAEILHGFAVVGERLPGGQGSDVMRS